jgi:hypothetical protein
VLRLRGAKFKSYADHFIPPVLLAKQHLGGLLRNATLFLARDFHMDRCEGSHRIFLSLDLRGRTVPIPYREILLTAQIMDRIFDQLRDQLTDRPPGKPPQADLAFQAACRIRNGNTQRTLLTF